MVFRQNLRQPIERTLAPAGDDDAFSGRAQTADMIDGALEDVDRLVRPLLGEGPPRPGAGMQHLAIRCFRRIERAELDGKALFQGFRNGVRGKE